MDVEEEYSEIEDKVDDRKGISCFINKQKSIKSVYDIGLIKCSDMWEGK